MKFLQIALTATALAAGSFAATAGTALLSPNPAEVQAVTTLEKVTLAWDIDDAGTDYNPNAVVLDAAGTVVATCGADYDVVDFSIIYLTMNPAVKDAGEYTLVIPANMSETLDNDEIRITYVVEGGAEETALPINVTPANGETLSEQWQEIRLEFNNAIWYNTERIQLAGPMGAVAVDYSGIANPESGMWAYKGDANPFITLGFNYDGKMVKGQYTLTIEAGAFGTEAGVAGETNADVLVYTWTNDYEAEKGDATPLELYEVQLVGLTLNADYYLVPDENVPAVLMTEGVAIRDLKTEEDGFSFTMNHGYKTGDCRYEISQELTEDGNSYWAYMLEGSAIQQEDGSFIIIIPQDLKLFNDRRYKVDVHAWSGWGYQAVEHGQGAEFYFTGTNEPFHYSSAELVATVPDSSNTLKNLDDNRITLVFTEKVTIEKSLLNLGSGMSTDITGNLESKAGRGRASNVWYVEIPKTYMDYRTLNLSFWAVDENGLRVKGETEMEDKSYVTADFESEAGCARIVLGQSNAVVDKLEKFSVIARKAFDAGRLGINDSWCGKYPTLRALDGTVLATVNMEYAEEEIVDDWTGETYTEVGPYKVLAWLGSGGDAQRGELEFCMVPAITEPGDYVLDIPFNAFACGDQFSGIAGQSVQYRFTIAAHHNVSYSVDHHSIALAPVASGNTTKLNLNVEDGWKLSKLTQNGRDITEKVAGGEVVSEPVNENTVFAAQFEYDGVVTEPTGVNDVVTDLNLRAWSAQGTVYVAGLMAGQDVKFYTTGGALISSSEVNADDTTLRTNLPAGIYVITVTDGTTRVALKVNNQ